MGVFALSNLSINVSLGATGAELLSFRAPDGEELLWQGEKSIWGRRGPVIFPILGGWPEGYYLCNGEKYTMDKNGFARLKAFDARQTDDSTVVFTLQSDSSTFRQYPFDFLLSVKYRITGSTLHVTLRVKNNSDTPMPAGLGLHPGFVWKRTGEPSRLVFSDPETVQAFRPDGKRYLLMDHENVLALTRDSFSRGAITMEHLKSRWVEFHRPDSTWKIRVHCAGFSYFTIWSMATDDAEFVCLEPSTTANTDGNRLTDRRGIISVPPGGSLTKKTAIELLR